MPKRDEVAARRARVLQLRAAGLSYQAIADQVGLPTASAAAQDAKRALKDRQYLADDQAALAVTLEAERLDGLERAAQAILQTAIKSGEHETALRSVDRLVRLSDRRGRLLGLNPADPGTIAGGGAGAVEVKVRADIAALATKHPMSEALTSMAVLLARRLDAGVGDRELSPLTGRLAAVMAELAEQAPPETESDFIDELHERRARRESG